jgi:cytochrome c
MTTLKENNMRARWIFIPATALIVISAGQALTTEALLTATRITEAQASQALTPEALAKKSGCLRCHSVDKNVVGPAYHAVAERYNGNARARAELIETVKNGGKGKWADVSHGVPMPPHSGRLSTAEIERLVDWVLSLKGAETK